jgi:hypothetical protein
MGAKTAGHQYGGMSRGKATHDYQVLKQQSIINCEVSRSKATHNFQILAELHECD